MRLGVAWESCPNAYYRAIDPLEAMQRRGHEVVFPAHATGELDPRRLATCDVVHVYRRANKSTRHALAELARAGVAITYDNDDDFTVVPKRSSLYKQTGGLTGQRIFQETVKVARQARWMTTTNDLLADKYRAAGIERVEVIENQLSPSIERPQRRHPGVVIGWIAASEHMEEIARLKLTEALERLLADHEDVRVECIGVNLAVRSERYRHDGWMDFKELPRRIGGWDIGIAPLADMPWNRTRSSIKLKEYAASGVPWLASPVGPYLGLGEDQGGRLVPDDGWYGALERLVSHGRERRKLAKKAAKWAKRQTIEAAAGRWERLFSEALVPR